MSQGPSSGSLDEKRRRQAGIASELSVGAFIRIFDLPRLSSNSPHSLLNSHLESPLS